MYDSCLNQGPCVVGKAVFELDYNRADEKSWQNLLSRSHAGSLREVKQEHGPDVLIVRVEGGVVASGLRRQVERRGRRHRLPSRRHLQALPIHSKALLI